MDTSPLVVKLGGAVDVDHGPVLRDVADLVRAGEPVVLVHGGSAETDRLCRDVGHEPRVLRSPSGHEGRHTDPRALELFVMATALVNRRMVGALNALGATAAGLSGLDGGTLLGRRKGALRTVEDGRVRVVRDDWSGKIEGVDPWLLRSLLAAGLVPVVAPVAGTSRGEPLNVDGDRAAAAIAAALEARALVLATGVPGLMRRFPDPDSVVRRATLAEADALLEMAEGRMKRKVIAAREALEGGVPLAVIAGAGGVAPLRAALAGGGTHIRQATLAAEVTP